MPRFSSNSTWTSAFGACLARLRAIPRTVPGALTTSISQFGTHSPSSSRQAACSTRTHATKRSPSTMPEELTAYDVRLLTICYICSIIANVHAHLGKWAAIITQFLRREIKRRNRGTSLHWWIISLNIVAVYFVPLACCYKESIQLLICAFLFDTVHSYKKNLK